MQRCVVSLQVLGLSKIAVVFACNLFHCDSIVGRLGTTESLVHQVMRTQLLRREPCRLAEKVVTARGGASDMQLTAGYGRPRPG